MKKFYFFISDDLGQIYNVDSGYELPLLLPWALSLSKYKPFINSFEFYLLKCKLY